MTYAYRVGTNKKDQWQALLDEGSIPLRPKKDDPTITDATALAAGESGGSYKTLSK
jgi:hypothetical protein